MTVLEKIKQSLTYFDGATGSVLQQQGLPAGESPERWNLTHPDRIIALHCAYLEAGADIIKTNTFGVNPLKFDNVNDVISAAVSHAKRAVAQAGAGKPRYIAYDMGPLGKLLEPLGDLPFEEAVALFAQGVRAAAAAGADLILIETMNDTYETKAAVLAAKENSTLPVFVTTVYDEHAKLLTGATPEAMVALLEGLRVDALGMNCSLGPQQMAAILPRLAAATSLPIIVNPNAGLPRSENGTAVYDVSPTDFAEAMAKMVAGGATIVGGCCGTTPDYIRELVQRTASLPFCPPEPKSHTVISSYARAVQLGTQPLLIGERINPTGKPRFKQALRDGDIPYVLAEGIAQQDRGVHALDVNVGLPELDEPTLLPRVVRELQAVVEVPLQLDTVNSDAMQAALRIYNGKPLINSVNGKAESMHAVFPLVARYGGVVIALTMDEQGIPATAAGRVAIARRIAAVAATYGIDKKEFVIDPLAMAVSSAEDSAEVTLETVRLLRKEGFLTSLGVSNISFGLPHRDWINAAFFAMALENGLHCAILNPYAEDMLRVYHSYRVLHRLDAHCEDYIAFASENEKSETDAAVPSAEQPLSFAIRKGLKQPAFDAATALLATVPPLEIVNRYIVPALDEVGRGFEQKTVFLPQLLMSAEAATAAFEAVKQALPATADTSSRTVILATVKGDIHDIGKNIVKVLLQNYGFRVIDLGRDVPPETVLETAKHHPDALVGLSALMTTTVPAMAQTIALLHTELPQCKVVVGGAVLTAEYAARIGADCYARDAMETVRYAESILA